MKISTSYQPCPKKLLFTLEQLSDYIKIYYFFFKKKLRFFKETCKKNNFQYLINKNHILRLLYVLYMKHIIKKIVTIIERIIIFY